MRVAFFCHKTHSGKIGGADRSLINLLEGLGRYSVDPLVVAPAEGELTSRVRSMGIDCRIVPFTNAMSLPLSWSRMGAAGVRTRLGHVVAHARALPDLLATLRRASIQLVHSNSSMVMAGFLSAMALRLPHVWHLRELPEMWWGVRPDPGWLTYRHCLRASAACIAVSETVKTIMSGPTRSENVHVVYNGVLKETDFHRRRATPIFDGDRLTSPRFVLIGGMHASKGQAVAIRALSLLMSGNKRAKLLLVGGGDTGELRGLSAQLGVSEHVEFWGPIDGPWKAFESADAVLVCSAMEPMGRVTVEAMAAGLPVIGNRSGGTAELVTHHRTGLLYEQTADDLACWMSWLIDHPMQARAYADTAWVEAREKFTVERYASRVYEILAQAYVQRPSTRAAAA